MSEEKNRKAKVIWDSMSEEERMEAERERAEIFKWWNEEEDKAIEKMKAAGCFVGGLDGCHPELEEISKEATRKLEELLKKVFGKLEDKNSERKMNE